MSVPKPKIRMLSTAEVKRRKSIREAYADAAAEKLALEKIALQITMAIIHEPGRYLM